MMRLKKGSHFLNVTEATIMLFLIVAGIIIIFASGKVNVANVADEVLEVQSDFVVTQALRTLVQTPVEVNGDSMLAAEAIHEFFRLYLEGDKSSAAVYERYQYIWPVEELIKNSIGEFMENDEYLYAVVYYKEKPFLGRMLFEGSGHADNDIYKRAIKDREYILLPAYFNLEHEQAGDYQIHLVFYKNVPEYLVKQNLARKAI